MNGQSGISLVFLIIMNDQNEKKSINKQKYEFLVGQSHHLYHESNCLNDTGKGLESFFHCKFDLPQKSEAMHAFWSQRDKSSIIESLSGAHENPGQMSWVSL